MQPETSQVHNPSKNSSHSLAEATTLVGRSATARLDTAISPLTRLELRSIPRFRFVAAIGRSLGVLCPLHRETPPQSVRLAGSAWCATDMQPRLSARTPRCPLWHVVRWLSLAKESSPKSVLWKLVLGESVFPQAARTAPGSTFRETFHPTFLRRRRIELVGMQGRWRSLEQSRVHHLFISSKTAVLRCRALQHLFRPSWPWWTPAIAAIASRPGAQGHGLKSLVCRGSVPWLALWDGSSQL